MPYGQDDPNTKPQSLKARFELLPQTLEALQKENEMLKQCLLEMSEIVYA